MLILVPAITFWAKTAPIAMLALRYVFRVPFICHQKNFVAPVLQENYTRLKSERLHSFDNAFRLSHSLS